jgi:hypothetical protein
MIRFLPTVFVLVVLALNACSANFDGLPPGTAQYCDNFLIYDMCARDLNRDGEVDLVYFTDTMDIFMYREGANRRIPADLTMHRCARLMDEDLVATTSRLFFIGDTTTFLEKQDIRGAMMIKYIAYMPEVTACQMRSEQVAEADPADS